MTCIAPTPEPPYWAAIFTTRRTPEDEAAYQAANDSLFARVETWPGFLGFESARGEDRVGITVSYWRSKEEMQTWVDDARHRAIQDTGRERWYELYATRVARVETARTFFAGDAEVQA